MSNLSKSLDILLNMTSENPDRGNISEVRGEKRIIVVRDNNAVQRWYEAFGRNPDDKVIPYFAALAGYRADVIIIAQEARVFSDVDVYHVNRWIEDTLRLRLGPDSRGLIYL